MKVDNTKHLNHENLIEIINNHYMILKEKNPIEGLLKHHSYENRLQDDLKKAMNIEKDLLLILKNQN